MMNGTEIKRLWMGNKGNKSYIASSYVMTGAEENWINAFRGNNKIVEVKENGDRYIANDHGMGTISVWTGNKFETVRVG